MELSRGIHGVPRIVCLVRNLQGSDKLSLIGFAASIRFQITALQKRSEVLDATGIVRLVTAGATLGEFLKPRELIGRLVVEPPFLEITI